MTSLPALGRHEQPIRSLIDTGHIASLEQMLAELERYGRCCP